MTADDCFQISLVLISVIAIITYRVIMDIDYCPTLAPAECLMLTTVLSSVLNAISILLLSKVGHSYLPPCQVWLCFPMSVPDLVYLSGQVSSRSNLYKEEVVA